MINKYLILSVFLFVSYLIFGQFLSVIGIGIVFSITLYPLFERNLLKLSKRTNSFFITLMFSLIVIIPVSLLIVIGGTETKDFISSFDSSKIGPIIEYIYKNLESNKLLNIIFQDENFNLVKFNSLLSENFISFKNKSLESLQSALTALPSIIFYFLVICLTIYFTLLDANVFKRLFLKNNFYNEEFGSYMIKEITQVSRTVVLAVLVSSIIQTTIILIPALIFNLNSVILIAFTTFFMGMIPIVGTAPVIIYLIISHFFNQDMAAVSFYVLFGIFIGLADNVFRAKFIEKKSKIHPLIAFLSTIGGIKVFGFFGIFLGPIIVVISIKALKFVSFKKEPWNKG